MCHGRCRVLTMSDFAATAELAVRTSFGDDPATYRYDVLGQFGQLAAAGRFSVPIARAFALEEWREALDISASRRAQGKLIILQAARRRSKARERRVPALTDSVFTIGLPTS